MAHNSKQKDEVELVARDLEKLGIKPWFDRWNLPPGRLFQDEISRAIPLTRLVAIFIGKNGIGPWEDLEQKAAISQFVLRKSPVIPVFLPSFDGASEIPLFLREFSAVRFTKSVPYEESLRLLLWGIRGTKTERNKPRIRR